MSQDDGIGFTEIRCKVLKPKNPLLPGMMGAITDVGSNYEICNSTIPELFSKEAEKKYFRNVYKDHPKFLVQLEDYDLVEAIILIPVKSKEDNI